MVDVLTEIVINKPIEIVAGFASDPDNAPKWYENIKSVKWKTAKPLSLGSKIAFVANFMGKELSYTYEVVEMTNTQFVMRTAQGPFPMETTYSFHALDASNTRVTLRNKGNPKGFSKLFSPFISMMMRRANNKDLKKLKQLLEEI